MEHLITEIDQGLAHVTLARGKVNAINSQVIAELDEAFRSLEQREEIRAIVLTGRGKFFSYGFDVPEIRGYSRDEFVRFFRQFTSFYTYLFQFRKPVIAAINGHAVAGGCMLALACDRRVMVDGYPKISLNEITFASSVFAGSVEMLRFAAGGRAATAMLYSGWMYTARDAAQIGVIDEVAPEERVLESARKIAADLGARRPLAFSSIKRMLREPVAEQMMRCEPASIEEMAELWSTEPTRSNLQSINIR